jgi:hypothetical protein
LVAASRCSRTGSAAAGADRRNLKGRVAPWAIEARSAKRTTERYIVKGVAVESVSREWRGRFR